MRARLMLFNDVSHYRQEPSAVKASLSKWWDDGRAPLVAPRCELVALAGISHRRRLARGGPAR